MTAMPDARRLAARSVALCGRLGMDDAHAVATVVKVTSLVEQDLLCQGVRDTDWLWELRIWALQLAPDEVASAALELEASSSDGS